MSYGAPAGNHNAVKSAEKFFKAYTWATEDNPEQELTDEELARHQETHREVHAACLRLVLLHDLTPTSMHAR